MFDLSRSCVATATPCKTHAGAMSEGSHKPLLCLQPDIDEISFSTFRCLPAQKDAVIFCTSSVLDTIDIFNISLLFLFFTSLTKPKKCQGVWKLGSGHNGWYYFLHFHSQCSIFEYALVFYTQIIGVQRQRPAFWTVWHNRLVTQSNIFLGMW